MVSKKAGSGSDDDDDEEDNNSSLWYNNLGKADGYSVVIYPIVKSNKRDALLTLCPLFKLVSSCEKASGVSALLNSPVVMFSRAYLGPQSDRKESEAIAFSLFHAIRWMRELLNVFHSDCCGNSEKKESSSSSSSSSDEDSPSSNKAETIVKRLDNLCELIERYTNVSKEWASPKLPGPPLPLPVPVTIPKRLFFRKSVVGNDNDNMSFRDLEFSTVLDLLQLLGDQEDDSELHKVSTKFRFLLTELAPRFSGDDTLIGTSSRDELAYAASVLGKLFPRYIWMIRDVAEHNRGNNDEMIVYDDLKVSAMYAINFVNRLISVALGASDIVNVCKCLY